MKRIALAPSTAQASRSSPQPKQSRLDLAREADAILRRAHTDTLTGAVKDKHYRRNKRAESKYFLRHWRKKQARLGTSFGAASPVRSVSVK
jgi:hypothetical protein